MREIKFRAWDCIEEKMVSWERLVGYCDISYLFEHQEEGVLYHNIPMQYTGKEDVDSGEIYEGDILRCENDEVWVVSFSNRGCFVARSPDDEFKGVFLDDYEFMIIGNIYQNKDLLK